MTAEQYRIRLNGTTPVSLRTLDGSTIAVSIDVWASHVEITYWPPPHPKHPEPLPMTPGQAKTLRQANRIALRAMLADQEAVE